MPKFIDLAAGRAAKPRRGNATTKKTTGHKVPDLVRAAASAITRSVTNPAMVERHLSLRAGLAERASGLERGREVARLGGDLRCWQTALTAEGALVALGDGTDGWAYAPRYRAASTGRLSEIGGGLQTASRPMKAAARVGTGALNFDMASAQVRLLKVELDRAGIDSSPVALYVDDPSVRPAWAAEVGVPARAMKTVVLGLVMGARAPTVGQAPYSGGRLVRALAEAGHEGDDLQAAYGRLLHVTAELRAATALWHDYLLDEWAESAGRRVGAQGNKLYVENAVGARVAVEDLSDTGARHEVQSRLAAHVLQGLEVSVTHRLAVLGEKYGYEVWSHEHDGLVTSGPVPEGAVREAVEGAGLPPDAVVFEEDGFGPLLSEIAV